MHVKRQDKGERERKLGSLRPPPRAWFASMSLAFYAVPLFLTTRKRVHARESMSFWRQNLIAAICSLLTRLHKRYKSPSRL